MIEKLILRNNFECDCILEFLNENENYDFYFTESNMRYYVTDRYSLKKLMKSCITGYCMKHKNDYQGIAVIWKGINGDKIRYYVKISAINSKVAKDLITVLLWNSNKDLYTKVRKDSKFLDAFKQKGFKFIASRGIQLLLHKKYIAHEVKVFYKKED